MINCKLILRTVSFFVVCLHFGKTCFREEGKCCEHYTLKQGSCKPCPPGYTGDSCRTPCSRPSFGLRCQYVCQTCSQASCHHVNGCPVYTSLELTPKPENVTSLRPTLISDENTTLASGKDGITHFKSLQKEILIAFFSLTLVVILGFLIRFLFYKAKLCEKLKKSNH